MMKRSAPSDPTIRGSALLLIWIGASALLEGVLKLAIWHGAPPTAEPFLDAARGPLALLAGVGIFNGRRWGRWALLPWAALTAAIVVGGARFAMAEQGIHPSDRAARASLFLAAVLLAALAGAVVWLWRRVGRSGADRRPNVAFRLTGE